MMWRPLKLALVPMSLSLLLEDRRKAWVAEFAAQGRVLRMSAAGKAESGEYDPHWLGLALDAFVAWRAAAGERGREAELRWSTRGGQFHLEWLEPPLPSNSERSSQRPRAACGSARASGPSLPGPGDRRARRNRWSCSNPAARHLRLSWPQVAHRPRLIEPR